MPFSYHLRAAGPAPLHGEDLRFHISLQPLRWNAAAFERVVHVSIPKVEAMIAGNIHCFATGSEGVELE